MGTQKDPKIIVKDAIGRFEGLEMVFNLCQFLRFRANF